MEPYKYFAKADQTRVSYSIKALETAMGAYAALEKVHTDLFKYYMDNDDKGLVIYKAE